jgi:hypothetical protein
MRIEQRRSPGARNFGDEVLADGEEEAVEHSGPCTHRLVVADGQERAHGGLAKHADGIQRQRPATSGALALGRPAKWRSASGMT